NYILIGVVEGGTGKLGSAEGYTVAGKTGTAQKVEHGSYSDSKIRASCVGYVPAEAPQLAIGVIIGEPLRDKVRGQAAPQTLKRGSARPQQRSLSASRNKQCIICK